MSELLIRVSNALYNSADVLVNGKKENFANNSRGSYELSVPADSNVEIQIVRKHELTSPLWLLWGLLFFVISCFGIFDVRYPKTAPLSCRFNVACQGNGTVQFTPNIKKDGTGVVVANDNCVVDTLENSSDEMLIKKRRKTLTIIKLLLWLALIAAIVLFVIFKG